MSSSPTVSSDLQLALELADLADSISLPRFQAADLRIDEKPDRTFVTDADIAVEQAIRSHLAKVRPDDGFLGEESGSNEGGSEGSKRRWILDPIDGTSNFLRGVPNWGTLIALEISGVQSVGVVSAPAFQKRWYAQTGAGAWLEDHGQPARRIQVSGVSDLQHASLSFQSIAQWRDAGRLDDLLRLSERVWRDRAYGDLWSYMLLAEGQLEIVAEFDVKPYDLAALVPIVREAGGSFTDISGKDTVSTGSALATNGKLHRATQEMLG